MYDYTMDNMIIKRRNIIINHVRHFFIKDIAKIISSYDYDIKGNKYTLPGFHKPSIDNIKHLQDNDNLISDRVVTMDQEMIKIWDIKNLTDTNNNIGTIEGHDDTISCLEVILGGKIVTASHDHTIKIWDADNKKHICTLLGHNSQISYLTILSNKLIASASIDGMIKLWNISNTILLNVELYEPITLHEHRYLIILIKKLPHERIISVSADNTIKLWDLKTNGCVIMKDNSSSQINQGILLKNELLLTVSNDGGSKLWDLNSQQFIRAFGLNNMFEYPRYLNELFNGKILCCGWYTTTIEIWNLETKNRDQVLHGHDNYINCICELPDGRIISGSKDKTIKIWDLNTGICDMTINCESVITCFEMLPDGRFLSGFANGTLSIWS